VAAVITRRHGQWLSVSIAQVVGPSCSFVMCDASLLAIEAIYQALCNTDWQMSTI